MIIFDKNSFQIVDLIISKRENGECHKNMRNISECLEFYFNFPSSLLEDALVSYLLRKLVLF